MKTVDEHERRERQRKVAKGIHKVLVGAGEDDMPAQYKNLPAEDAEGLETIAQGLIMVWDGLNS